jgi:hypothetical protein
VGNSIFDDDDDGFSLSGGIEGEESKATPPAPVKPVAKTAPSRPEVNRLPNSGGMPHTPGRRAVPARPSAETPKPAQAMPKSPSLPTQRLTVKPTGASPTLPQTRKPLPSMPSTPASTSLPAIPPAVYAKPEETYTEDVIPSTPIQVEKNDISYAEKAEESLHENYRTPVDYEAERIAEEKAEERAAERRRERIREQERADRIVREREERENERRRLEKDTPPEAKEPTPAKPLSRKEQASTKREAEKEKRDSRKNKGKAIGGKPVSNFSGERSKVLILRVIAFSAIAILAFAGLKSAFIPTPQPTANNIIQTAKYGMGITKFPTERGSAFVIGFSKVYLTVLPNGASERTDKLEAYAPGTVISAQGFSQTGDPKTIVPQTVTSGPYVSGVTSKDDKNAVYTVSAEVNGSQWIYLDVPVQYNLDSQAFVISGPPSFVPAPKLSKLEPVQKKWKLDDTEAVKAFKDDANLFFAAWSKSDYKVIDVHTTPKADISAKSGLDGVVSLKDVTNISIESAEDAATPDVVADDAIPESNAGLEGTNDKDVRKASVVVIWNSNLSPGTSYSQSYDLVLVKASGETHWKIASLKGGIPVNSTS